MVSGYPTLFSEAEAVMPIHQTEAVRCVSGRVCGAMASADKLGLEAPERSGEMVIVWITGAGVWQPSAGPSAALIIGGEHKA